MVSVFGITGSRTNFEKYTYDAIKDTKNILQNHKVPLAVGFGISNPKDGKNIIQAGADGIIIGSSIMKLIMENETDKKNMLSNLSQLYKRYENSM